LPAPPSLRDLQLRLRALIAHAGSRETVDRDRFERAVGELPIRAGAHLSAARRVEIYATMYFARLREAIVEDYGGLARALGPERFDELLRGYLETHPPHDPSLRRAAADLAAFVASEAEGIPEIAREPWVRELARFEAALVEAFDAVDEPVLTAERLSDLGREQWPDLVLRPVRSLVLLAPVFAVEEMRNALLTGGQAAPICAAPGREVRVWRQDLSVYHRRISSLEATALRLARDGEPFATICSRLAEEAGSQDPAEAVLGLLSRWLDDALLVDTIGSSPT
jgi:Putative DNA-binding domain